MQKIFTFLMFEGKAEEAMNFYISLFDRSEITDISRYEAGESGAAGTIKHATFTLSGQQYMCIDSIVKHTFTFTPATSLYVRCESEVEIDRLFGQLVADGQTLMPLGPYPFSKKFGWLTDRYGVSWQLTL